MEYRTVKTNGEFEYDEKKSRFIGRAFYTPTPAEAQRVLEQVRAGDPEARHHVYAYRIREGNLSRMSDDGEPSGTGGAPVFNVLKMNGVEDVTVTVTRYFGGILLGTGGLTRAYAKAAAGALQAAGEAYMCPTVDFSLSFSYPRLGSVTYALEQAQAEVLERDFAQSVRLCVTAEPAVFDRLREQFSQDPGIVVCETGRRLVRK